jgi:hypothetical protein
MAADLAELKKQVFYDLLALAGRVFIAVRFGDDVLIGKRGFLAEEKKNGLILVFNQKMNFTWDEDGISVTLVFGTSPEKCFVPQDKIMTIFSPELKARFSVETTEQQSRPARTGEKPDRLSIASKEKVIKVDFNKKKQ